MPVELGVVRVEAAQRDVQELDARTGDDKLGRKLQRRGELVL